MQTDLFNIKQKETGFMTSCILVFEKVEPKPIILDFLVV